MRWRRLKRRYDQAREILANLPRDLVRPKAWWDERASLIRHALVSSKAPLAYKMAKDHRIDPGRRYAEAEWLAGWIALRFLKSSRLP